MNADHLEPFSSLVSILNAAWEQLLDELPLTPAERRHPTWIPEDAPAVLEKLRQLAATEVPADRLARADQHHVTSLVTALVLSRLARELGGMAEVVDVIERLATKFGIDPGGSARAKA